MNYEAVYRTAPATPGLLNKCFAFCWPIHTQSEFHHKKAILKFLEALIIKVVPLITQNTDLPGKKCGGK